MKHDRLQVMKELMLKKREVTTAELCDTFGVSIETIRRDLNVLEREGVIRKVYGGAVLADDNATPALMAAWKERARVASAEKTRIAKKAVEFVPDDCVLVLDSGTTMYKVARELRRCKNLTVLSNSLYNVMEVSANTEHLAYCVGGAVKKGEEITTGFLAADFFGSFGKIDVALISADGLSLEQGITDYSMEMGLLKRRFIQKSGKVIAVADHTKFGVNAMCGTCDIERIDILVTDKRAPAEMLDEMRRRGIQVVVV